MPKSDQPDLFALDEACRACINGRKDGGVDKVELNPFDVMKLTLELRNLRDVLFVRNRAPVSRRTRPEIEIEEDP